MTKNRDVLIDQLKGYACILVAFGHVIMGIRKSGISTPYLMKIIENFIWTFHVALFMFLSGYVFYITGGWKSKGGKIRFLVHKILNLGVPYLFFSIVYIVINSFISSVNNNNNIIDIFYLWKKPVAQYWFLYALFYLFVIWTICSDGSRKNNIIVTVICFGISVYSSTMNVGLGIFSSAISMAFAFGLGTVIGIDNIKEWKIGYKMIFIVFHFCVTIFFVKNNMSNLPILDAVLAILGILSSIILISELCKITKISKLLLMVNRYSFPIYLLHTIFTAGIRIVLIKLGVKMYIIHVAIGISCALICPYICMKIAEKNKYLTFLFYPSKILKTSKIKRLENKR